jgi:BirA family biotin operon repressor/biotin-[acetyl-CoA-carboxylase] ligase
MDVCRELAVSGAEEFTIVVADEQTKGRGRVGREWFSPPGQSLYLSVLLRPTLLPSQLNWITMIAALAIVDVLNHQMQSATCHARVSLKWFNDVLLNGKKIAGILVESSFTHSSVDYAVLGIGINVNTDFTHSPVDIQTKATSLKNECGVEVDREEILQALLSNFSSRYQRIISTRVSPSDEFAKQLETLGRFVRMNDGNNVVEGIASHIEDDGTLIVTTTSSEKRIRFGDVES